MDFNLTYAENGNLIINYSLNADDTFNFWQVYPIENGLPKLEVKDLEEAKTIIPGVTRLINGKISQPESEEPPPPIELTDKQLKEKNVIAFRIHRKEKLKGFDIWEKAVLRGREEDSGEVMSWYQTMLDFTDLINKDTTPNDYPQIPEIIRYYLGSR